VVGLGERRRSEDAALPTGAHRTASIASRAISQSFDRRGQLVCTAPPVQRRAPFLVRAADVRVHVQEELHRVGEAFVGGPVQGASAVVVVRVHVRVPPHLEVVDHPGMAVLRGNVDGAVPSAVHLLQARAAAQEELRARQRAPHCSGTS
jgi:hypothetical protein